MASSKDAPVYFCALQACRTSTTCTPTASRSHWSWAAISFLRHRPCPENGWPTGKHWYRTSSRSESTEVTQHSLFSVAISMDFTLTHTVSHTHKANLQGPWLLLNGGWDISGNRAAWLYCNLRKMTFSCMNRGLGSRTKCLFIPSYRSAKVKQSHEFPLVAFPEPRVGG